MSLAPPDQVQKRLAMAHEKLWPKVALKAQLSAISEMEALEVEVDGVACQAKPAAILSRRPWEPGSPMEFGCSVGLSLGQGGAELARAVRAIDVPPSGPLAPEQERAAMEAMREALLVAVADLRATPAHRAAREAWELAREASFPDAAKGGGPRL